MDLTLLDVWSFLENSAKMGGVLIIGSGVLMLILLLLLYPLTKDET